LEQAPKNRTIKVEKINNGYDLWIGSKKAAAKVSRILSRMYDTRIVTSKKLIGEDDQGKRKYWKE
jgi:NMD protein affecting ribosome stability and mRNA decay